MDSIETDQVGSLISSITSKYRDLAETPNNEARKFLAREARKLVLALETDIETTLRLTWCNRAADTCIQTGLKMHLFEHMSLDTPKTCAQLAIDTGSDVHLLRRILKHLAAMDYITETTADTYTNTRYSQSLTNPLMSDAFPFCLETVDAPLLHMPKYLESTQFQNPSDPVHGPFQHGHKSPDHFFDMMAKNSEVGRIFNSHMQGCVIGRKRWIDDGCYPVQDNLITGMDVNVPLLVDIGGGTGYDINAFHTRFQGECILQELPEVVKAATPVEGVKVQEHDMFTPQPVRGARAYYLHAILHDWSDEKCVEILQNIKPAMKRGYSKILINEYVIPSTDAYWMSTGLDLVMMSLCTSWERTEEAWYKLLESAGLKVNKVYNYELGTQSLIEAELA